MNRPPNILWMVTDHQAYANRPNVAKALPLQTYLSHRGTRLTRAYAALPICSPSRATMLTGLYPHNHGLTENDGRFGGRLGLDKTDWLINQDLSKAGYRCGWFGKWHLSQEDSATDFGFEGYSQPGYGYPYNTDEYKTYLKQNKLGSPIARIELAGESRRASGSHVALTELEEWFDYESGTAVLEGTAETHEAFFVSSMAEDWLRTLDNEPFFLRVDTWGPHPPYIVAPPYCDMFPELVTAASGNLGSDLRGRPSHHIEYRDYWQKALPPKARDFGLLSRRALQQAALCENALLRLPRLLEETGLIENTIIVYCADHGDAVASNGGVLNKGGLMVEETLRIPLLISGPGICSGRVIDELVGNIDLVPTLLDAAGLTNKNCDGFSLLPLLTQGTRPARSGLMCEHYGLHTAVMQRCWHMEQWKLIAQEDGFIELYNLEADPCELTNLAKDQFYKNVCDEMISALKKEMQRSNDPAFHRMHIDPL